MLRKLKLQNVRLFAEKEWEFPLPKLAVFCGTNSAGKSTLLKSILLIRQSLGIQETLPSSRGRLRFVGNQVDLGDYCCFVSDNEPERTLRIGIDVADTMSAGMFEVLRGREEPSSILGPTRPVPYTFSTDFSFECDIRQDDDPESFTSFSLAGDRRRYGGRLKCARFCLTDYPNATESLLDLRLERTQALYTGEIGEPHSYDLHIPQSYFKRVGGFRALEVTPLPNDNEFLSFGATIRGLLPDTIKAKVRPPKRSQPEPTVDEGKWQNWPLPPHVNAALRDFRRALSGVHYLGPLRSAAKRFYVAYGDTPVGLDSSGDFVPVVLRDRGNDPVQCCHPFGTEVYQSTLVAELNNWLMFLRTNRFGEQSPGEIDLSVTSDVLVEIRIKGLSGISAHALTDSGFGFSQLLPILVRGLLAKPDSTLVVEQPELHLNPSLQVRLAYFFAAMVRAGKQIILETHSEHLVNALRVICAEDEDGELAEECRIFFLSCRNGRLHERELSILPDGMVADWPVDFFGEAADLSGRLLRAQARYLKH